MKKTKHAEKRIQQRGIKNSCIDLISAYGEQKQRLGNARSFLLTRKRADKIISSCKKFIHLVEMSKGIEIIVSNDNKVITAYHRR
jgi:hypothetical protein